MMKPIEIPTDRDTQRTYIYDALCGLRYARDNIQNYDHCTNGINACLRHLELLDESLQEQTRT